MAWGCLAVGQSQPTTGVIHQTPGIYIVKADCTGKISTESNRGLAQV